MGFVDDCIMSKPEQSAKIDISALIIDLSEQVPTRSLSCEFGVI